MPEGPIRRAQLISPFGVGAMTILPNGTSVIAAGLDYWFTPLPGTRGRIDPSEFELDEWRLSRALAVNHFRLPPDFRRSRNSWTDRPNQGLKIPFLRFPTWNFCRRCRRLSELPLLHQGERCSACREDPRCKSAPYVTQVPLVAICPYGHITDFPWREWVHGSGSPNCQGQLFLRASGGASLAAQMVSCDCGERRNLAGVTEIRNDDGTETTVLSETLSRGGAAYLCSGQMPWHGTTKASECGRNLKASLRSASNLYYSLVRSSIYLPRETDAVPAELVELLAGPPISTYIAMCADLDATPTPEMLRNKRFGAVLIPFTDEQLSAGLTAMRSDMAGAAGDLPPDVASGVEDTEFRRVEQQRLRCQGSSPELEVHVPDLVQFDKASIAGLARIALVDQLRETRALWGFNRINADGPWGLKDRKELLRRDQQEWAHSWLPAYVVHGEGIYMELDTVALSEWEADVRVATRAAAVSHRFADAAARRQLRARTITPRLLLLHTLAHLLMIQLTYECGYSSAALRERLYVADDMAGILIYTASGDAEGTMGGLVRMGRPGNFEPVFRAALASGEWCSADPVCMEVGQAGQGPDSCNMAACHACALVPETACEEFNRFLDRAVVVGTHADPSVGFFSRFG